MRTTLKTYEVPSINYGGTVIRFCLHKMIFFEVFKLSEVFKLRDRSSLVLKMPVFSSSLYKSQLHIILMCCHCRPVTSDTAICVWCF